MKTREDYVHFVMYESVRELMPDEILPFNIQMTGRSVCFEDYYIERIKSSVTCFGYVLDGGIHLKVNDIEYYPVKGDLFIMEENKDHFMYAPPDGRCEFIWFQLYGNLYRQIMENYGVTDLHHVPGIDLKNEFSAFLDAARSNENRVAVFDRCAVIFLDLVQKLSRHIDKKVKNATPAGALKYEIDYITDYSISFDELISRVHISKSHAIRCFKAAYGITPYKYLMQKKMQYASNLLRASTMSISEITARIGCCDEKYFSVIFKRTTGYPPLKYRNLYRTEREHSVIKNI